MLGVNDLAAEAARGNSRKDSIQIRIDITMTSAWPEWRKWTWTTNTGTSAASPTRARMWPRTSACPITTSGAPALPKTGLPPVAYTQARFANEVNFIV